MSFRKLLGEFIVIFRWLGKSEDGGSITLCKLHHHMFTFPKYYSKEWAAQNADLIREGAAIDVETTGLDHDKDQIIEIGLRTFKFNRETGEILCLGMFYSGFQDPGMSLSAEIIEVTGITDEMVAGQNIDWGEVDHILSACHIIIAHNASFDRPFIEKHSIVACDKIWACSLKQVGWKAHGFPSQKLDILSIYHGFFADAHRALNDTDALIYLLSFSSEKTKIPYLLELLNNARKDTLIIHATNTKYEKKDLLKSRKYQWDDKNRNWWKEIDADQYSEEIKWLEEFVYEGQFRGQLLPLKAQNRFKLRKG